MRATITTLLVLAAALALDAWAGWDVPSWGWVLLTVAAVLAVGTDLALAATKRRAAKR